MNWFQQAADSLSRSKQKPGTPDKKKADDAQAFITQWLLKNPDARATALANALKSNGFELVKVAGQETKEADSASANTQALKAKKKFEPGTGTHTKKWDDCVTKVKAKGGDVDPYAVCTAQLGPSKQAKKSSKKKEAAVKLKPTNLAWKSGRFTEAAASDDGIGPTKFRVTLLQEGLGNFKDAFFYTKEALESGVQAFEGKKVYADHPSAIEEQSRPERSVRDVLGHFENLTVQESDGRHSLVGDVVVLPDKSFEWARGLMRHSVDFSKKYPDKDFVGLSINANGDAEAKSLEEAMKLVPDACKPKLDEAKAQGIDNVRFVSQIKDAVSCDLVTEAGAGGKILNLLEGSKDMADDQHDDKDQDMKLIKKMVADHMGKKDGEGGDMGEAEQAEAEGLEKIAHEAYQAYTEMGMKQDEAMKNAEAAMKLAKHMAAKKAKEAEGENEAEAEKKEDEKKECMDGDKKESASMRAEMAKLQGRIAFLENDKKKGEIKDHLDKLCKESKLPNKTTDQIREAVKGLKTKEEVTRVATAFINGFKEAQAKAEGLNFALTEKAGDHEAGGQGKLDFSDCI